MINLDLGEGPGPSVVSGRCFPSTLSHVIHRAFQTEGESFCFFLANMQPSSVSTSSICSVLLLHLLCSPLLPLQGSHFVGFLGPYYYGSISLVISKPEWVTSLGWFWRLLERFFSCSWACCDGNTSLWALLLLSGWNGCCWECEEPGCSMAFILALWTPLGPAPWEVPSPGLS